MKKRKLEIEIQTLLAFTKLALCVKTQPSHLLAGWQQSRGQPYKCQSLSLIHLVMKLHHRSVECQRFPIGHCSFKMTNNKLYLFIGADISQLHLQGTFTAFPLTDCRSFQIYRTLRPVYFAGLRCYYLKTKDFPIH